MLDINLREYCKGIQVLEIAVLAGFGAMYQPVFKLVLSEQTYSLKVWTVSDLDTAEKMSACLQFWNLGLYLDGLVQDCSNPNALAMELLQSYTKHMYEYLSSFYSNDIFQAKLVLCPSHVIKWSR